jgi:hypothetical protein
MPAIVKPLGVGRPPASVACFKASHTLTFSCVVREQQYAMLMLETVEPATNARGGST